MLKNINGDIMVSVTLAIPAEVKQKMERFNEINWSGFVRNAIIEKTRQLELKQSLKQKLEKESEINGWAVGLQRRSRKQRLEYLKKKKLV
ncbi:hypothetical protein JW968_02070 [Candidatus Woesearchaeota archaeon]|nr:hypothetical protein [Candidatus Woesearchaeota archaeon]